MIYSPFPNGLNILDRWWFITLYQGQHWQKQITYYRRNFQNDRRAHSPRNPPGKPESSNSIHVSKQLFSDQRGKMKRDEHIQIVMKTMKLIISYWRRMHTIENSKAEGYIRNNCETQSIHYKIDIKTRSLTNNTKLSSKKTKERTCKKFSF